MIYTMASIRPEDILGNAGEKRETCMSKKLVEADAKVLAEFLAKRIPAAVLVHALGLLNMNHVVERSWAGK